MSPATLAQATGALRIHEVAIDSITDMVAVVGEDQIYRMVNEAWCRATGLERDAVLGRTWNEVFPEGLTPERVEAARECLRLNAPQRLVANLPGLPGVGRHVESRYYPYGPDDGGVRCVVIVSRDITEQESGRRAVLASERLLRRTLDATGEGILAVDALDLDHPVRLINQQALELWRLPPSVVHTLTLQQFLHHAEALVEGGAEMLAQWDAMLGSRDAGEHRITLKDGRTLHCRCSASDDTEGEVRVWSFRDVSAEVQAMQRLAEDRRATDALLDAFPGPIGVFDEHLVYRFANQRLGELMGRDPADMVGRGLDEVLSPEQAARVRRHAAATLDSGSVVYERDFDTSTVQVTLARGQGTRSGQPVYYAYGVDITPIKQAQRALEVAHDQAQRANQAKSQFLSHMSHELRTPLNAVLGFAQLLQSDSEHPLSPRQQRELQEIVRGGRHLLTLINDVLDLGLIEAGRMAFDVKPLALGPLVQECLTLVQPLADQRDVKLRPPRSELLRRQVVGDATRVKQVLLNLLGNAIKYNRPGGEVRLGCQERRRTLRLSVRDTGPGLSAQQQSRLFTAFERVHDPAANVEGSGIGLALCRRLMHGMGGEIGVDSSEGMGSRFWIELPRGDAADDEVPQTELDLVRPARSDAVRTRRVLYIEDNAVNVVLMQAMLSRLPGVALVVEEDAAGGLAQARREPPDLILLDIQLPGISGLELLRLLREDALTRSVPVIAVSANAMAGDIAEGLAAGFVDYITKPVDMPRLISAVQAALEGVPQPASAAA